MCQWVRHTTRGRTLRHRIERTASSGQVAAVPDVAHELAGIVEMETGRLSAGWAAHPPRLAEGLAEAGISLITPTFYNTRVLPLTGCVSWGSNVASGNAGVGNLWRPYGFGDMLERVYHLAYWQRLPPIPTTVISRLPCVPMHD